MLSYRLWTKHAHGASLRSRLICLWNALSAGAITHGVARVLISNAESITTETRSRKTTLIGIGMPKTKWRLSWERFKFQRRNIAGVVNRSNHLWSLVLVVHIVMVLIHLARNVREIRQTVSITQSCVSAIRMVALGICGRSIDYDLMSTTHSYRLRRTNAPSVVTNFAGRRLLIIAMSLEKCADYCVIRATRCLPEWNVQIFYLRRQPISLEMDNVRYA